MEYINKRFLPQVNNIPPDRYQYYMMPNIKNKIQNIRYPISFPFPFHFSRAEPTHAPKQILRSQVRFPRSDPPKFLRIR